MNNGITLPDDAAKRALGSIRRYFAEQLDQQLGELPAQLLLEFFLKELGPSVYNAAIADAQTYLQARVTDMEGACYEPEFAYWKRGR